MKKLIFLATLLVTTVAEAKPYLVKDWTNETRIVMTNETCLVPNFEGHRAVIQSTSKRFIRGCWRLVDADQHVRIDWDNPDFPGDFSVLPFADFRVVDDNK
jgi:hypothetical protein